jgi:predicted RNase H-like nuclease (RuvC/YqgF family)
MKSSSIISVFVCAVLGSGLAFAQSERSSAGATSLGELARQLKAERQKEQQKPAKVYTNDNIPAGKSQGGLAVASGISKSPSEEGAPAKPPAAAGEKSKEAAKPAGSAQSESKEGVHDEEYYRTRASALREQLDLHKRELNVLQQKLSLNEMQYYPDPNKALQQEYSRSDINKLNAEIQKKQDQIAEDEQAIEDLRDQLRREGGDPVWLR